MNLYLKRTLYLYEKNVPNTQSFHIYSIYLKSTTKPYDSELKKLIKENIRIYNGVNQTPMNYCTTKSSISFSGYKKCEFF